MKAWGMALRGLVAGAGMWCLLLSGCGGGGGDGSGASREYTIGGNVSGLAGAPVVLQNNGGDDLTVAADGTFTFSTTLTDGAGYEVTVLAHPKYQTCSISLGKGNVSATDINNVSVVCATNTYTVGGTITGLSGSVTLQNNSGDDLILAKEGPFTFATPVADLGRYDVTVTAHPAGQSCSLAHASGFISSENVTDVAITCVADTFPVGGTVMGLDSNKQVVLQNNGVDDKTVIGNAPFTFDTAVPSGSPYDVTVASKPPLQSCAVFNGSGTVTGNVSDVVVSCFCVGAQPRCNGVCVDYANDSANCGQCGNVCPGGTSCSAGTCI